MIIRIFFIFLIIITFNACTKLENILPIKQSKAKPELTKEQLKQKQENYNKIEKELYQAEIQLNIYLTNSIKNDKRIVAEEIGKKYDLGSRKYSAFIAAKKRLDLYEPYIAVLEAGHKHRKNKNFDKAINFYQKAIKASPDKSTKEQTQRLVLLSDMISKF